MNTKPQTLDPKMKAIYDQVMGTVVAPPSIPAPATATSIASPSPVSANTQVIGTNAPTPAVAPRPTLVTEQTQQLGPAIQMDKGLYGTLNNSTSEVKPSATINKVTNYTAVAPNQTTDAKKGKSPFLPILLTLSGLIFFVVYTVFWIKFFNLSIPFLPI